MNKIVNINQIKFFDILSFNTNRLINLVRIITIASASCCFTACVKQDDSNLTTRSYRMGFANSTPRYDIITIINTLNMWTSRSDAAIISSEIPWDSLYAGVSAISYIQHNYLSLVNFYTSKNLPLYIYMDPANGLNRSSNSSKLTTLGKSITQSDVQKKFTEFLWAMDSLLKPAHIGFALETNLIRAQSPDSIYQAIKAVANQTAAYIKARDKQVKMGVSIQADWAWGKFSGGNFIGIDQDLIDSPFVQEIGISSYPYFVFNNPEDIPINYYSQLISGKNVSVFVAEGGWNSETVNNSNGFFSSTQKQANYFKKLHQILNNANALFQLTFNDINIKLIKPNDTNAIKTFIHIGLVDTNLQAKPALYVWDSLFKFKLN